MNRPTEKHIEQFVRYPAELSVDERKWIKDWIDTDDELALLADWYRDFYKTTDQIKEDKEKTDSVPEVILLQPFENRSAYSNGFVLAAQTPATRRKGSNLKTVKTFVSEKHKTLIRILHDESKRQSKLYVISEFVGEDDIVLIEVPEEDIFLVTEPGGSVTLPDQKTSEDKIINWSRCKLHLSVAKVRVFRDQNTGSVNIDSSGINQDTQKIDFEVDGDQLKIAIDVDNHPLPDKLVLLTDEKALFRQMDRGECSIGLNKLMSPESCLYFFN